MKHLLLGFVAVALFLTSCSPEEVMSDVDDTNNKMLESFEIKRNTDGSYALTHEVREGVASEYTDEKDQNDIFLYSDDAAKKEQATRNYNVEDNKLNLIFTDDNNTSLPQISISDDNTEEKSELDLLNTYAIVFNQDGTVQLDFKVETGVDVSYGYNYDEDIHDIYLTEGTSTQLDYSKNYPKDDDGNFRVDFVQMSDKSTETKKPRVIVSY